ncbi:hypothetical protein DACRYDRAFT_109657 [Dacryopinax primogenitus]|uniref:Uncharacterized protein n=1 Tax=Dacryopinax primogenitus (strain DJM 731) TaxID=1858805 RepID=M5FTV0_DACPD|nr:uncharacterized protein DACRYDRAFT_109657 [Dacryopinax primogenitus]EJT99558.1 hypothetical protein DACRYDRAFT_109657 [Dacryopinax primogenitus]
MPVKKTLKPMLKLPTSAQLLSNVIKIINIMVSAIGKLNFLVTKYVDEEEKEEELEEEDANEFFGDLLDNFLKHHSAVASSPALAEEEQSIKVEPSPAKGKAVATVTMHTGLCNKNAATPKVELFILETLEPESCVPTPTVKKKKAAPNTVKAKKWEREGDKGEPGPLHKWSCLPEAKVKLPVTPLGMAEHKMLELRMSLQMAQKAVNTATGWADQVQTLLGRALAE